MQLPADPFQQRELSKWLPDERMHLFKAHLPSSLISADILLGNPLNPIPDKWIWQVNKHPASLLLKYYAPVRRVLPCIHFHALLLLFKRWVLMMEGEKLWLKRSLPGEQSYNPRARMRIKKSHGSGSPCIPLLKAAEVHRRPWPCPKPGQTHTEIQLPVPKVGLNLIYCRCGSWTKGNAAELFAACWWRGIIGVI